MPAWSNISCAQWIWPLREPKSPFSVRGVRPAISITGTCSRRASMRALMVLAVPTLTCTITACGRPLTM
jgi:hypothetical protein